MQICILGNEMLRQKAEKVEKIDTELVKIAQQMLTLIHNGKGIGLAGPQVGVLKRFFVVHIEGDIPRIFINPSIIETSRETVKFEEGCLSLPGAWANVVRAKDITVQAWNERGRPFTLEAGGILARVILHEYDHLDGKLFIDYLTEAKREKIVAKFEKQAKEQ
ncbi:MAG: peptide deformylase [Treponema sp.]|nr:peptide deformylase [Treponema sp.]